MIILVETPEIFVGQSETRSEWAMIWGIYREFPSAYDINFMTKDNKRALAAKDPGFWSVVLEP